MRTMIVIALICGSLSSPLFAQAQATDRDLPERPDTSMDDEEALRELFGGEAGVRIRRVDSQLKKRDFCVRMDWPDGWSCIYCERGGMMCVCSGDCR